MNKAAQTIIILTVFMVIFPALARADIVYVKDDDRLYGSIQTPAFTVQTPYGKVRVNYSFLKRIEYKHGSIGRWVIETINNDHFSGALLNDSIRFKQEDKNQKTIKKEQINRMQREIQGSSRQITTTIFTMQNGDRFCGTFLNSGLEMTMNYMTKFIQTTEINRIEFKKDYSSNTKILLKNGDLLEGTLKQNQFRLMPSAASGLSVLKSNLKSIQFNAPKLVLRESSGSLQAEKDSDGDGIPDYADLCMDTPTGVTVGVDGCARRSHQARTAAPNKINDHQKDPENLMTAESDQIPKILFDFDRAELKPQYYAVLDETALMLSRHPQTKVEIHGHTDNIGTEEYNQYLSERRAQVVEQYLVQKGIAEERLVTKGFGFTINAASNQNGAGRALNRRAEILLMPDQKRLAHHNLN
jgi:outer membrane protein OmpA-like peptidoglycan-associated protein